MGTGAETTPFDPVVWEGTAQQLPVIRDRQVQYRIQLPLGGMLDMFAVIRSSSDKVVISGQDALNRSKPPLPYFARWSWHEHLPCSFVTFNDPTLYRSETMLGGWCQYDAGHFGVELIAEVLDRLLTAAGIAQENAVLYGTSAGGFWALMTGALLPAATVVVDIPQTDLLNYPQRHHVRHLLDVAYAGIPQDEARERFAHRLVVSRYYEHLGRHPHRVIYHQNVLDPDHVETQMKPFVEATRSLGIVELRMHERSNERGGHVPRDKPGSIAAMLEPLGEQSLRTAAPARAVA
jgi:pimeloyl-ACP methyl ester carboxylesterase